MNDFVMLITKPGLVHIQKFLPNFKISDFFCKCHECDSEPQKIDLRGAIMLQELRNYIKRPIHINSPYRCIARNTAVKGATKSEHLDGQGWDISVQGMSGYDLARAAFAIGFRRIGIAKDWCHVGTRDTTKNYDLWTYSPLNIADIESKFENDTGLKRG
jgi:hypothetical protein